MMSKTSLWALLGLSVAAFAAGGVWYFVARSRGKGSASGEAVRVEPPRVRQTVAVPAVKFMDVTKEAGIRFAHVNGSFGKKLLPETMGSGVAVFDYDLDGRPDILFINSCYWPGYEKHPAPKLALYRNTGDGQFVNVTEGAGLGISLYGMGVTVGDYDNDGRPDLYITALGGNRLFRNRLDSQNHVRFEDVTQAAGVAGSTGWPSFPRNDFLGVSQPISFPSSASFFDFDCDGLLDLFVCNYVQWSPQNDLVQPFTLKGKGRAFGAPTNFEGSQCTLYRNLGGGKFEDVSAKAGIFVHDREGVGEKARARSIAKSLGVYICDVDEDGWPDIFVANDTVRNFLFHNNRDGTFEEIGRLAGVAFAEGRARGAMGIDGVEYRPGRFGVVLANFADEPNTFLRLEDRKQLLFTDAAIAEGISGPSRALLKFGAFFFDYDLDGRQDLLTCNGHLEPEISLVQPGQTFAQPAQLFWNSGGKATFVPVGVADAGFDLYKPMVGRGSAFGDFDGNGTLDVVLTANGGPARLLKNEGGTGNHWLRLRLEGDGKSANRSAIGAMVTIETSAGKQRQQVVSGRGYLSQSEMTLTFGLGSLSQVKRVEVRWPTKKPMLEEWTDLAADKLHHIVMGKGKPYEP